jgi:hypothetical protein
MKINSPYNVIAIKSKEAMNRRNMEFLRKGVDGSLGWVPITGLVVCEGLFIRTLIT